MDDAAEKPVKKWIVSQAWVAVVATFLTLVLGIILSELQTKLGWTLLLFSLACIYLVFFTLIWLILRYVFAVSSDLSEDIRDIVGRHIDPTKIGWMLSTPGLAKYEKRTKFPDIWLISSDMQGEVVGGPFHKVVTDNLKRGVKYTYFVPDRPDVRARVQQVILSHGKSPNLYFVFLDDSFFFLVPRFDFAIYNPFAQGGIERSAYMGIPVKGESNQYHVKVSDDLIDVLIGKLMPPYERVANVQEPHSD